MERRRGIEGSAERVRGRSTRVRVGAVLALGAVIALAVLARREARFVTFGGEAMATRWEVVLPEGAASAAAAEACFALYRELDLLLSEWKPGSPLSAVNRAAGTAPVEVPAELFELLERALDLGARTDGAFDVSWAALWGLWDFRAATPRLPADGEIEARRRLVDYRRVVLDAARRTVFLPEAGMQLGLGGIGKGYALERAAALLEARGFTDFLLVGGGQVVARGRRGDRPWRVGVRDPRGGVGDFFARVEPGAGSLSTSADNESFFVVDGVRYHHVLDPRTGWPATGLRSATVLHPDATLADALSTAALALDPARALEVVHAAGGEAILVDSRGGLVVSPGLAGRIELLRAPRTG